MLVQIRQLCQKIIISILKVCKVVHITESQKRKRFCQGLATRLPSSMNSGRNETTGVIGGQLTAGICALDSDVCSLKFGVAVLYRLTKSSLTPVA
jgi:hypothetical protein